ncbi:MAG: Asp-tRNA(Asn)/Glu-tRNA(Gln) amidotransferase subunit GatA [Acidobacteria bacterium]|nr:Asp-tRNA(Asn)/Glu-tRNA(Gln) amidotransferase subunit GatA [Acidobacteriota bacterium]
MGPWGAFASAGGLTRRGRGDCWHTRDSGGQPLQPLPWEAARPGLDAGDLAPEALLRMAREHLEREEPTLGALQQLLPEGGGAWARAAHRRLRAGERGGLLGLPFVVKDNFALAGHPMGCGSRILEGYRPPFTATVVGRLLEAGAVPIASARMDEFAMGSSGEYCAGGATRNPWDPSRVPGGSSSGPAVAVAADYVPFALGSDTGGSVRLPAGFCGVSGLRPTFGVLSRWGIAAMASSLDQAGPIARSAVLLAEALHAMAGRDSLDILSVDLPRRDALKDLGPARLRGLRVGLPKEYLGPGVHPGIRERVQEAMSSLAGEGADIVELSLPSTEFSIETYYLLCTSEVSSNMSRYDGMRFGRRVGGEGPRSVAAHTRDAGFGAEVKRRILLGSFCLSRGYYDAFYLRAQKARTLIRQDFDRALRIVDVLAGPISPTPPFRLGEKTRDPLEMYLADIFTVGPALAGLPCVSLPAGLADGLPVGLQFIARSLEDVFLLELAHAFQQITSHHKLRPGGAS